MIFKYKKTLFNTAIKIIIHKRYYPGGKEVGHAAKVLSKITPVIPPTTTPHALQSTTASQALTVPEKTTPNSTNPLVQKAEALKAAATIFQKDCNKGIWGTIHSSQNSGAVAKKDSQTPTTSITPSSASMPTDAQNKLEIIQQNIDKSVAQYNDYDEPKKIQYTKLNGDLYETCINENTTVNDITNDHLKKELSIRGLTKIVDNKNDTSVKVLLENDEEVALGKCDYKFSVLGQAYSEKYDQEHPVELLPNTMEPISENPIFALGVILPKNDVFLPSAKQKHLLCVYSESEDKYYVVGYLTSKISTKLLSEKQFKVFQNEQEGLTSNNKKAQYIHIFNNIESVSPHEIQIVKWGTAYLDNIEPLIKKDIKIRVEDLSTKPLRFFEFNGISKEKCIAMCRMYDQICKKKSKHPISQDEILTNEKSKLKNAEDNKKNKLLKQIIYNEKNTNPFSS